MTLARALVAALALALTSCSSPVEWEKQQLPTPPGAPGTSVVGDVVRCGDSWYAVGGVYLDEPTVDQDTRPAVWRSQDGEAWEALDSDADTYWGSRAILYTAACAGEQFSAMGSRSGGGHGFPRFSNFTVDSADHLVDEQPHLSVFGGLSWAGVGPLNGGAAGWLVVGNRESGPAVWLSDDGMSFERLEGVPQLADDDGWDALASGAVWTGAEWVVVGGATHGTIEREPLAWTSPDGRDWTRVPIPGLDGFEDIQRVVRAPGGSSDDLLAVGLVGDGFGAWQRDADGWELVGTFGSLAEEPTGAPYVASLASTSAGLMATVSDGEHFELWRSDDGNEWEELEFPVEAKTGGDRTIAVSESDGKRFVVVATDDNSGSVWTGATE
ncbi:MAG TPA: hypothetical protein VLI04_12120 [Nocardioidaceae bacterium]|nr:hypothetical protein [Nocardioidaceae bacterium]